MVDIMLDLETLGSKPGSIILSIGAVAFSLSTEPADWPEYYSAINIESSRKFLLTSDESTIAWWKKQSSSARAVLEEADDPLTPSLDTVLGDFARWVRMRGAMDTIRLWGNGSDFDNVLLIAAFQQARISFPWKYSGHRCFRTLKALFPAIAQMPPDRGVEHNALDDARAQAVVAADILRHIDLISANPAIE